MGRWRGIINSAVRVERLVFDRKSGISSYVGLLVRVDHSWKRLTVIALISFGKLGAMRICDGATDCAIWIHVSKLHGVTEGNGGCVSASVKEKEGEDWHNELDERQPGHGI